MSVCQRGHNCFEKATKMLKKKQSTLEPGLFLKTEDLTKRHFKI
jgi:hypothetical protein